MSVADTILNSARLKIADAVKQNRIQAGPGVSVQGRGVRVWEMPDPRRADGYNVREGRDARSLVVEVMAGRGYVNVPPMYGAVATLGGVSIFAEPRPSFRLSEEPVAVWARLRYRRRGSLLGWEDPEEEPLEVGLTVEDAELTVEVLPQDTVTENMDATGGERSLPPYAGLYESWFFLGTASTAGAVAVVNAFPVWGGQWPVTQGFLDSEEGRFVFTTRDVQS